MILIDHSLLLRRGIDTKIDGKIILDLPPRTVHIEALKFSKNEQKYYDDMRDQAEKMFNRLMEEGTVMENSVVILVFLLRLRQACNHPYLNPTTRNYAAEYKFKSTSTSSKIRRVLKLIEGLNGQKVLVFSDFTSMLDLLE